MINPKSGLINPRFSGAQAMEPLGYANAPSVWPSTPFWPEAAAWPRGSS